MMRRSRLLGLVARRFGGRAAASAPSRARPRAPHVRRSKRTSEPARSVDFVWYALLVLIGVGALVKTHAFRAVAKSPRRESAHVVGLGFLTLAARRVLIALASLIWVPIGVWVGLRPRVASIVQPIAQFLAAFPANLLFPIVVSAIVC